MKDTKKIVSSAGNNQGKPGFENEGEGNKTAARNYNEAQQAYVRSGRAENAAKEAAEALDNSEADDLRRAEEFGRAGEPAALEQVDADEGDRATEPDLSHD